MITMTIQIPDTAKKTMADLVKQLGGKVVKETLSQKEKDFLKGLDEAVEFVNLHQQGKVKAQTLDHFLNEL